MVQILSFTSSLALSSPPSLPLSQAAKIKAENEGSIDPWFLDAYKMTDMVPLNTTKPASLKVGRGRRVGGDESSADVYKCVKPRVEPSHAHSYPFLRPSLSLPSHSPPLRSPSPSPSAARNCTGTTSLLLTHTPSLLPSLLPSLPHSSPTRARRPARQAQARPPQEVALERKPMYSHSLNASSLPPSLPPSSLHSSQPVIPLAKPKPVRRKKLHWNEIPEDRLSKEGMKGTVWEGAAELQVRREGRVVSRGNEREWRRRSRREGRREEGKEDGLKETS